MKPNKGFITVFMMVLISISLSTFSRAAFDTFSDVPNDSPFHESICYLAERGIVCGEGNGRYVPDAPVTVRQWAMMLRRALGNDKPLNYDDDCIRQGYSDGWLEMTAITAPDSDLCRYAIYKSGFAAFGVDLYSLQLYPNEGKLSQQSEVLRAAADFGLCEDTCDGTEIITRGEAAELLYALLTKTFAVVPPPMLDNIPLDNKAGVALNNYLLEIQKIPESMMQSFAEKDWRYVIDFDYLAKLSKKYDLGCTGATIYEGRKIIIGFSAELPLDWIGQVEIKEEYGLHHQNGGNCITFYHKPTHDNGEGGILFFIDCYPGEWSEDNPPVIAGHSVVVAQTEDYTYLLRTPSDVEYSESDSALAEAYQALAAQQDFIIAHIKAIC